MSGLTEGMTKEQRLALADSMFRAMGFEPVYDSEQLAESPQPLAERGSVKISRYVCFR